MAKRTPSEQVHPPFGLHRFPAGREMGQKLKKKCLKPPTSYPLDGVKDELIIPKKKFTN